MAQRETCATREVAMARWRTWVFVAAAATLVGVVACVGDGHEAAQVAHVHLVGVGRLEQTLPQELGGAVGDLTITLHLTETQTAITGRRAEHDWLGEGREGV